ncbi:MAG: hypothetical protein RIR34_675 [Actinomycetota bacterium]
MSRSRAAITVASTSDAGSAAIDFLGFGLPTVLLALLVMQLLLAGYVKNIALDAAAEGAAQASAADGSLAAGVSRANAVMRAAAPWAKTRVTATTIAVAGAAASSLTVTAVPSFVMFGLYEVSAEDWSINEIGH